MDVDSEIGAPGFFFFSSFCCIFCVGWRDWCELLEDLCLNGDEKPEVM